MSKKRVRLNKEEAISLGLEVKKTEQGRNTFRAYIDIESQQKLNPILTNTIEINSSLFVYTNTAKREELISIVLVSIGTKQKSIQYK